MCQKSTCSICLENVVFYDFKINPKRRRQIKQSTLKAMGERLVCGHLFHQDCIKKWFLNMESESSDKCPMCRQQVRFSNRGLMINRNLYNQKEMLLSQLEEEEEQYEDAEELMYFDEDEDEEDENDIDMEDDDEEELTFEDLGITEDEIREAELELSDDEEEDEQETVMIVQRVEPTRRQVRRFLRQEQRSIDRTRHFQPIRQKVQKRKMY